MIVLDASAGVGLVRKLPEAEKLASFVYDNELVVAPDLYVPEVAHVFSKYVRGGFMTVEQAQESTDRALSLVDTFVDTKGMAGEVAGEAVRLSHSTYDLFYLVTARRRAATLLSLDKRLIKLAMSCGVSVITELTVNDVPWIRSTEEQCQK